MKIENILIPALVRGGFGTFYYTLSQPSRICFLNPVQHADNPQRYPKDDLLPRPTGNLGASVLGQKMALLVEALIFYSVAFGLLKL